MYSAVTALGLLSLLLRLAAGSPTSPAAHTTKLVTFEDAPVSTNPLSVLLPEVNPVGNYNGLSWSGFVFAGGQGPIVTGVIPHSGSHFAGYGLGSGAQGLFGAAVLTPLPPYKTFSMTSLYFGCVANTVVAVPGAVVGIPAPCQVAFIAYLPGDATPRYEVPESFGVMNSPTMKMTQAKFTGEQLAGVERVEIVVYDNGLPDGSVVAALSALLVDDVAYTLNK
ncbi:unnamed protein product [Zymoseptoria tritici ST99CH_3D1]|nr:unnamed protein product [Zymoseptoria tritici ST99CH_3D1]